MIVVSGASPLISLSVVGRLEMLRALYGRVLIPEAVAWEVRADADAPGIAAIQTANWLQVERVENPLLVQALTLELDVGEAEAIALAVERSADLLLVDERRGRAVAARFGIEVVGVLGVLIEAKRRAILVAVRPVLDDLITRSGFYISAPLYRRVLEEAGESTSPV